MTSRPNKTLADYFAIAISPALIMLLVWSLCFFVVEVFYRGEAIGSVRWVLFWFVLAVVLVSRIGIEQGTTPAAIYGVVLAVATWLYLVRIHPAFIFGAILLGVLWWCAHKLTWDCTLIDYDQDASGVGLLQIAWKKKAGKKDAAPPPPLPPKAPKRQAALHPPGAWLIYFSLAALPLFGIGQTLLPAGDAEARHLGFVYLFVYLCAALGLFLTTSFLGLRRYLCQRYLPMPGSIALGWLKFGAGIAIIVLFVALLLPRPGAGAVWGTLRYQIDYRLRQASEYAMQFSPHGSGPANDHGRGTSMPQNSESPSPNGTPQPNAQKNSPDQLGNNSGGQNRSPEISPPPSPGTATGIYSLLKLLVLLAIVILIGWWVFRNRLLLLQMCREFWAALVKFFRELFSFKFAGSAAKAQKPGTQPQPFASYQNPFATGEARTWTSQRLILYSYEALQRWADEQGIKSSPEQTAREFCGRLRDNFPELGPELNHLAFAYGHAAYGTSIPAAYNPELLKQLWDFISTPRLQTAA